MINILFAKLPKLYEPPGIFFKKKLGAFERDVFIGAIFKDLRDLKDLREAQNLVGAV